MNAFTLSVILLMVLSIISSCGPKTQCNDKLDNDNDSFIDLLDPGCASKSDDSEQNLDIKCDDGRDNDDDGKIDMQDPNCKDPKSDSETECGDKLCESGETPTNCPADCSIPNTCNDNDEGKRIGIYGVVTGISENKEYDYKDSCIDSNTVKEYFCDGALWKSEEIACAPKESGKPYCKDSSVYKDVTTYSCIDGACVEEEKTDLVERCADGCVDGFCKKPAPPPDPSTDSCVDSDNGNKPEVKGTVTGYKDGKAFKFTDFCAETTLNEFTCSGNTYTQLKTSCPNDEYGANFCKGNNVYRELKTYTCVQGSCLGVSTEKMFSFCDNGCADGKCIT